MKCKTMLPRIVMMALGVCLVICLSALSSFGGEPKAGDIIDASNVDQYADYLPEYMLDGIKDGWGGIRPTPAVIHVGEYTPNPDPKTFRDLTEKNKGKTQCNADGTISGWEGGLPFPDPKEPNLGYKILWNGVYHCRTDGYYYPGPYVTFSQRKGGRVAFGEGDNRYVFWKGRTVVDPKPMIPDNPKNLYFTSILYMLTPPTKDMKILTWRYDDERNDDMWTYVPTLRRTIRMVSGERQNPVQGMSVTWDDFYGFEGKIAQYTPTVIGERKILYLHNQQTFAVGEFKQGCKIPCQLDGPNDPWELVDMFEVDVQLKDPRRGEDHKKLWFTKDVYHCPHTQVYDKSGKLWKATEWGDSRQPTADGDHVPFQTEYFVIDFKTGFWNGALLRSFMGNVDLPREYFTPGGFTQEF